jgi:rod shape-determining protein MreD
MKPNLVRTVILAALLSLAIIAVNVSFLSRLIPVTYLPNLFVVLVIIVTLAHNNWIGVICIFIIGLFADISSGLLVGPWAAGFLLVYVVLSALADRVFVESLFSRFVVCGLCSALASLAFFALSLQVLPSIEDSLQLMLIQTISTALFGPIFFPLIQYVIGHRRSRTVEYPSILYGKR